MLGSLARKLRILGFDAAYYKQGDDQGLMDLAAGEHRVIITSDRSLAALSAKRGLTVLRVEGGTDTSRISRLLDEAESRELRLVRGEPLCSVCGGKLERVKKAETLGRVPDSVLKRHRLFFRCLICGRFYWRGGHWKKLRRLERLLDQKHIDALA